MAGGVSHVLLTKGGCVTKYVFVVDKNHTPLMPTSAHKARRLLKSKRAVVYKHRPFTICIIDRDGGDLQPVEYCCDTGYAHIGVSVKSEKREYISEQRDLLTDEAERHNDKSKYRRARRNRRRYRKERRDNRKGKIAKEGFAPSICNKRDRHIDLFTAYKEVCPITSSTFEMGQFDTQALKAMEEGKPLPQGEDYQHGERYGIETLREAVFTRDGYKCIVCGRSGVDHDPKKRAILHVHHVGFWKHDRTNRLSNLATVCEKCHTSKNHQPGGKLYGLKPKVRNMADATFMTAVRFDMFKRLKETASDVEFHMTYGAKTKVQRKELNIKKSHANDAYAMGNFHPKHRADTQYFKKRRHNNRILEKFYDAKIVDVRTGKTVHGKDLSCNRTKRNIPRDNPRNLRPFRGRKVSNGKRSIRRKRYAIQPGDKVYIANKWQTTSGMHCNGTRLLVDSKSIAVKNVTKVVHAAGWIPCAPPTA